MQQDPLLEGHLGKTHTGLGDTGRLGNGVCGPGAGRTIKKRERLGSKASMSSWSCGPPALLAGVKAWSRRQGPLLLQPRAILGRTFPGKVKYPRERTYRYSGGKPFALWLDRSEAQQAMRPCCAPELTVSLECK